MICSRSRTVRCPARGSHPKGLPSRCRPSLAIRPTIGAVHPDLARDVDQSPALGVQPKRELFPLPTEMTVLALNAEPPVISFCVISEDPLRLTG
jgi:hypothetical protein